MKRIKSNILKDYYENKKKYVVIKDASDNKIIKIESMIDSDYNHNILMYGSKTFECYKRCSKNTNTSTPDKCCHTINFYFCDDLSTEEELLVLSKGDDNEY